VIRVPLKPRKDNVLRPGLRTVWPRQALKLERGGGELRVLEGSVLLTRSGDLADYLVERGQVFAVTPGRRVVIESARTGQPAVVRWERRPTPAARWLAALRRILQAAAATRTREIP
jgi:hypothetical protein